jgi:hypothetical protein
MTDDAARWNTRYRAAAEETGGALSLTPPAALCRNAQHLPTTGLAVDLAGGNGGGALWLAERGLDTVLVDVSEVALAQAAEAAANRSLALVTACVDLADRPLTDVVDEVTAAGVVASGQTIDLITCFHYLDRTLLASVVDGLPSGAIFMAAIATVTNQERNARPSARFLLQPGELAALVVGSDDASTQLDVLHRHEGWNDTDHHEAELVVRRR